MSPGIEMQILQPLRPREVGGKQAMQDAGHTEIPQAPGLSTGDHRLYSSANHVWKEAINFGTDLSANSLRKIFNTIQECPKHLYICMPI